MAELLSIINKISSKQMRHTIKELYDERIAIAVNNIEEFIDIVDKLESSGEVCIPSDLVRSRERVYKNREDNCILIHKMFLREPNECEYILRYYTKVVCSREGYIVRDYSEVV